MVGTLRKGVIIMAATSKATKKLKSHVLPYIRVAKGTRLEVAHAHVASGRDYAAGWGDTLYAAGPGKGLRNGG